MARDSSEVSKKIQLGHDRLDEEFLTAVELDDSKEDQVGWFDPDHKHEFTYVYPAPASVAFKNGKFPHMICGCGLVAKITADENWWVPEVGPDEWALRP